MEASQWAGEGHLATSCFTTSFDGSTNYYGISFPEPMQCNAENIPSGCAGGSSVTEPEENDGGDQTTVPTTNQSPISAPQSNVQILPPKFVFPQAVTPNVTEEAPDDTSILAQVFSQVRPCVEIIKTYPDCKVSPEDSGALKNLLGGACDFDVDMGAYSLEDSQEAMVFLYVRDCLHTMTVYKDYNDPDLNVIVEQFEMRSNPECLNGGTPNSNFGCDCTKEYAGFDCR